MTLRESLSGKRNEKEESPAAGNLQPSPGVDKHRVAKDRKKKNALKDKEVLLKLSKICTERDPTLVYKKMTKIGQG